MGGKYDGRWGVFMDGRNYVRNGGNFVMNGGNFVMNVRWVWPR